MINVLKYKLMKDSKTRIILIILEEVKDNSITISVSQED